MGGEYHARMVGWLLAYYWLYDTSEFTLPSVFVVPCLVCSHWFFKGFLGRVWTSWTALDRRWIELVAGNWYNPLQNSWVEFGRLDTSRLFSCVFLSWRFALIASRIVFAEMSYRPTLKALKTRVYIWQDRHNTDVENCHTIRVFQCRNVFWICLNRYMNIKQIYIYIWLYI